MNGIDKRVSDLETRNKALEDRVYTLEQEMATCLTWMKMQAEKEAEKVDPNFKAKPTPSA
jgi:hypothetical protein